MHHLTLIKPLTWDLESIKYRLKQIFSVFFFQPTNSFIEIKKFLTSAEWMIHNLLFFSLKLTVINQQREINKGSNPQTSYVWVKWLKTCNIVCTYVQNNDKNDKLKKDIIKNRR